MGAGAAIGYSDGQILESNPDGSCSEEWKDETVDDYGAVGRVSDWEGFGGF